MASKRDLEHRAAKAAKTAVGKPDQSKDAAKGGSYSYDFVEARNAERKARR
jgi:hypothetical protein